MILSATLPNLSTLDTESLNGFLEQSQQQGYNAAQNSDWEHNILVFDFLMHCKSMVTHGKQTNDAIVQTALKQIRFEINLSDVSI